MKFIYNYFFKHPNENNMSYSLHFVHSLSISLYLFTCSIKALIHAFIPKFFSTSSIDCARDINYQINIIHNQNNVLKIN